MDLCRKVVPSLLILVLAWLAGCKKSETPQPVPPASDATDTAPVAADGGPALRLHWIGKRTLSTLPNATNFMAIWSWPESQRLEQQTLDKLATAPWRLLKGEAAASNATSSLLRPLLDDVVQSESFLEIRSTTKGTSEFAFAIKLENSRAALWQTNLVTVLESLTHFQTSTVTEHQGWLLENPEPAESIKFRRAGSWVLIARGQEGTMRQIVEQIQSENAPFASLSDGSWLRAEFDVNRVVDGLKLGWKFRGSPRVQAVVAGTGENVRIQAELKFNEPLDLRWEDWDIPTNLVSGNLNGFTAIRGLKPWLDGASFWNGMQVGPGPNQIYLWSTPGIPAQLFVAARDVGGNGQFDKIATRLMDTLNPALKPTRWGRIERTAGANRIEWVSLPFAAPFAVHRTIDGTDWIYGGSFLSPEFVAPIPIGLVQAFVGRSNLVYYDWEITGLRLKTYSFWIQMLRLISNKAQVTDESAAGAWLLAAMGKLGNAGTHVVQTDPSGLSITRASNVGFSAVELQILADWIESPDFPRGLHTFLASPPKPIPPAAKPQQ